MLNDRLARAPLVERDEESETAAVFGRFFEKSAQSHRRDPGDKLNLGRSFKEEAQLRLLGNRQF
jgi:hypothetical protein